MKQYELWEVEIHENDEVNNCETFYVTATDAGSAETKALIAAEKTMMHVEKLHATKVMFV